MCIAILNTPNHPISKKVLKTCWKNNPDGAGMIWSYNGHLYTYKQLSKVSDFIDTYYQIRNERPNINIVLHFRIATHGNIDLINCHPFKVNKNLAFVHNGIISNEGIGKDAKLSDTFLFNETILKKIPFKFLNNPAITELLKEYIGWSKLIFLDHKNQYQIVNEDQGYWVNGNWFSNQTYKEYKAAKYLPLLKTSTPSAYPEIDTYDNRRKYKKWETEYWENGYNNKADYTASCESCLATDNSVRYSSQYNADLCEDCRKSMDLPL